MKYVENLNKCFKPDKGPEKLIKNEQFKNL